MAEEFIFNRQELTTLNHLGDETWFKFPEEASIRVRAYTSPRLTENKIKEIFPTLMKHPPNFAMQLMVIVGNLEKFQVPFVRAYTYNYQEKIAYYNQQFQLRMLSGNYVIFSTPFKDGKHTHSETEITRFFDTVRAIYCSILGKYFLNDLIFDMEFPFKGKQHTYHGPITERPHIAHGLFPDPDAGEEIKIIFDNLAEIHKDKRHKIELALQFMNEGMNQLHPFFNFWMALEILVGKAHFIGKRIASIYNTSEKTINNEWGFSKLKEMRDDFVHKGIEPNISPWVQLYMQRMFLDLLRNELGLSVRGHLAAVLVKEPNLVKFGLRG